MLRCPNQRETILISTPAFSIEMAKVCLHTWVEAGCSNFPAFCASFNRLSIRARQLLIAEVCLRPTRTNTEARPSDLGKGEHAEPPQLHREAEFVPMSWSSVGTRY